MPIYIHTHINASLFAHVLKKIVFIFNKIDKKKEITILIFVIKKIKYICFRSSPVEPRRLSGVGSF